MDWHGGWAHTVVVVVVVVVDTAELLGIKTLAGVGNMRACAGLWAQGAACTAWSTCGALRRTLKPCVQHGCSVQRMYLAGAVACGIHGSMLRCILEGGA